MSSNQKVIDLAAVDYYYRHDENPNKATHDLVRVDDKYGGTTTHVAAVSEKNHDDASLVPNCVLKLEKLNRYSKIDKWISLLRFLGSRLGKGVKVTIDMEEKTVSLYGNVTPSKAAREVSHIAEVEATVVFYKEHPLARHCSPPYCYPPHCENIVFRICGEYWHVVQDDLQEIDGINSIIADDSHEEKMWISISGVCFDAGKVRQILVSIYECYFDEDIKKIRARHHKAANDTINILDEGNGALVPIDHPIVCDSLTKKNCDVEIFVDFIVPSKRERKYQRDCATKINKRLLSTEGVNFVMTHIYAPGRASVKVYGDDRLELDTILNTIYNAGGANPKLRKSLISQLISAFGSLCR